MSQDPVLTALATLEAAALPPPYTDEDSLSRTAETWRRLLGHLSPDELAAAVDAHLEGDRGTWWPRPAELLRLVPRRPAAEPDAPWPMAQLDDHERMAIHEQVADERAAGQWPTEAAMLARFRELAEARLRSAA